MPRKSNIASAAEKTAEEGKAFLKELGFDDADTPGRRRTRAATRGEVYTPPPAKKERKSATPGTGRRGRPRKVEIKLDQEAEKVEKMEVEPPEDEQADTNTIEKDSKKEGNQSEIESKDDGKVGTREEFENKGREHEKLQNDEQEDTELKDEVGSTSELKNKKEKPMQMKDGERQPEESKIMSPTKEETTKSVSEVNRESTTATVSKDITLKKKVSDKKSEKIEDETKLPADASKPVSHVKEVVSSLEKPVVGDVSVTVKPKESLAVVLKPPQSVVLVSSKESQEISSPQKPVQSSKPQNNAVPTSPPKVSQTPNLLPAQTQCQNPSLPIESSQNQQTVSPHKPAQTVISNLNSSKGTAGTPSIRNSQNNSGSSLVNKTAVISSPNSMSNSNSISSSNMLNSTAKISDTPSNNQSSVVDLE